MSRQAQTLWVQDFKGLNDEAVPGSSSTQTPDLRNVKIKNGLVSGRGGMTKYLSISSTSSTTPIIGLFSYEKVGGTNYAIRMTPTKLHKLNVGGASWDDLSVTLTGASTTRPQATIIDDILVMTNEGEDLPYKYDNSAAATIASGTSPYGKSIEAYLGYLFLGNVSDDGTFTDLVDGPRTIRYSDDWDNNWDLCDGNELILDETPGSIVAMRVFGRDLIAYKDDGLIKVTFQQGPVRFRQDKLPTAIGCLAPLSVQSLGDAGHIYLGTDACLYLLNAQGIQNISYQSLAQTLPTTISLAKLKYARSMVDAEESTYYLLYDRGASGALSGQGLDSYVSYNWRTGVFSKGRLGITTYSCMSHKPTANSSVALLIGTNDLVKEFDSTAVNDDGTAVERYVTTGWQSLGEEGIFSGARVLMKKNAYSRVKISVATDFEQDFTNEQVFNLKGQMASDERVELHYRTPNIYGEWFNIKIRFSHDTTSAATTLQRIGMEVLPLHTTGEKVTRKTANQKI